jgi:RND family efflux transporter MFP subunit
VKTLKSAVPRFAQTVNGHALYIFHKSSNRSRTTMSLCTARIAFAVAACMAPLAGAIGNAFAQTAPKAALSAPGLPSASAAGVVKTSAASSAAQPKDAILGCLIEPQRVADVGAPGYGVIEEVMVERGQAVRRGQPLVVLRSDVERANVDAARQRAGAEAEIAAAVASRDVARIKLKRTQELLQLGFASGLELDTAKGEFEVADQRLAQARESQMVASRELKSAEAQLQQRTIRAPFDGVVTDRLTQPGERADGRPLVRLAMLNPLRVEVIVPASLYGQLREGQAIGIQPDFAGADLMQAQVQQIDRLIDAASGTFRVRMSLPNPKREIPAGVRCKAQLPGS